LGGVTIGNGAIVGAGTLVSKNVPEKSMVAGNPMRIIKTWSVKDNMWVKYEN
jgi:acetyltransferase-like isoleucine patch superfamily enzyme